MEIQKFEHYDPINYVSFHTDKNHVRTGSWRDSVIVHSMETGDNVKMWLVVFEMFSQNGVFGLGISTQNTTRLVNLNTGPLRREWPNIQFNDIVGISNDGRFLADLSDDNSFLSIWSVDTDTELYNVHMPNGLHSFAFSTNNKLFLIGTERHVRVRSMETGSIINTFNIIGADRIVVSHDASFFITTSMFDTVVCIFDMASGRILSSFSNRGRSALTISPDDLFITSACNEVGVVSIRCAKTGNEIKMLRGHQMHVLCAAFSSDGNYAVTGSADKTARVWDIFHDERQVMEAWFGGSLSLSRGSAVHGLLANDGDNGITRGVWRWLRGK